MFDKKTVPPKKVEANRSNTKFSTGPRTEHSKRAAGLNAVKLVIPLCDGEDASENYSSLLNEDKVVSLSKRAAANRRNAQLSTGPRTGKGKIHSRRNGLKHGILASSLLITDGEGAEDRSEFDELFGSLRRDLAPIGALEEILVEKIAVCCWREKRALRCEAGLVKRAFLPAPSRELEESLSREVGLGTSPELAAIKDHLCLPLGKDLDRILRYETTIHRQLVCLLNQLERLQRVRKGEHIPAPMNLQLSTDR